MARQCFPFDSEFDFAFRPVTYAPAFPEDEVFLSRINGSARRDIVRRALAGEELVRLGDVELYREAMEFAQQEALGEAERQRWGSLDPALMGGEFLPVFEQGEVEIARVELASVTADVISIRARTVDGKIHYRVVDEYRDEGSEFAVSPVSSDRPLTLGEVVQLIDTARRSDDYIGLVQGNLDALVSEVWPPSHPDWLDGFVSVESGFYPQLRRYYELRCEAWLEAAIEEFEEEEAELVCGRVTERLEKDPDFARELCEGIAAAHVGDRLDWGDELSFDDSGAAIRRIIDTSDPEVEEVSRLGNRQYALRVWVAATVEVDFFIPKSEDPRDPSVTILDGLGPGVEILDDDFDRWSIWMATTSELYLGGDLVYDGAIDDEAAALSWRSLDGANRRLVRFD